MHSIRPREIIPELEFTTSRSSGPGGQNVNKVSSKVTVRWNIPQSMLLTADQKELLMRKWITQLTKDGALILSSQQSRSQSENKQIVLHRLAAMLHKVFTRPKVRKATKPSSASKVKRLEKKKRHAEKKQWRKKTAQG
jgi:ribosome-associated protein